MQLELMDTVGLSWGEVGVLLKEAQPGMVIHAREGREASRVEWDR